MSIHSISHSSYTAADLLVRFQPVLLELRGDPRFWDRRANADVEEGSLASRGIRHELESKIERRIAKSRLRAMKSRVLSELERHPLFAAKRVLI